MISRSLFLAAACALSLAACQPNPSQPSGDSASSSVTGRPMAAEGELCGGIAGIQCAKGLTCRYTGNYPDAAGTCTR